jgi:hypothetical protein
MCIVGRRQDRLGLEPALVPYVVAMLVPSDKLLLLHNSKPFTELYCSIILSCGEPYRRRSRRRSRRSRRSRTTREGMVPVIMEESLVKVTRQSIAAMVSIIVMTKWSSEWSGVPKGVG